MIQSCNQPSFIGQFLKKSKLAFEKLKVSDFASFYCQKLLRNTIPKWKELGARVFPN
jgi:hypothetical protein